MKRDRDITTNDMGSKRGRGVTTACQYTLKNYKTSAGPGVPAFPVG